MKKINLAENMLRFGVKNLKESDKQKLQQLTEQNRNQAAIDAALQSVVAADARNAQRAKARSIETQNQINKFSNDVADSTAAVTEGTAIQKRGFNIFSGTTGPGEPVTMEVTIRSQFYNNMVSAGGLMNGNMDKDIASAIAKINEFGFTEVSVKLIGTATNLTPGTEPDKRYRGKLTLAQDHGGTLYGGGQPDNKWLAQQRVNTLATKFAAACKTKGITANITTESQVVQGNYTDDAKRVSRAIITGSRPTLKNIPIGNPTMTFEVRYGESYRRTNQGDIDQLYKTNLKSKKGHAQHCWQASIYITFSNDKVEVVNTRMVIPGNTFKRNYANKANLGAQDSPGGWTSFESVKQPGMTYTADNVASDQAWLYNFLLSCGRFTKQQVDYILKDLAYGAVNVGRPGPKGPVKVKRSKILEKAWGTNNPGITANDETKGQGGTWQGNFEDFVQLYGGTPKNDPKLTKYVLDQNSFKIVKVNA